MQANNTEPQNQSPNPEDLGKKEKASKEPKAPKAEKASKEAPKRSARASKSTGDDTFFGNQDEDQQHPLPKSWADSVVVLQCNIKKENGGVYEVPNTHSYQTYSPELFDKFSEDKKGQPSFFSENKMKVIVLHDPRD